MHKVGLFLFLLAVIGFSKKTIGQQDSITPNTLHLELYNHNFFKNNEYSNNIADGYTLIGSQLQPKLIFSPHTKVRLELGVFGLTYAGLDKYHKVIPTFSFHYLMKNSSFIMGTLESQNNHNLIVPLMDEETQLDERFIENGLQYLYQSDRIKIDTWLNWESFIFRGSKHNEELVLGVNLEYDFIENEKWNLSIPLQSLLYHRGGQINTDIVERRLTLSMLHTALGIQLKRKLLYDDEVCFSSFFIEHHTQGLPEEYVFKTSKASLTWLNYKRKNLVLGIGYWYGDGFISPRGGDMYQSVSKKIDIYYRNGSFYDVYASHTEKQRSLILGKISYQKEVLPKIHLKLNSNLFYQNYHSKVTLMSGKTKEVYNDFDFTVSLSFIYKDLFLLYK